MTSAADEEESVRRVTRFMDAYVQEVAGVREYVRLTHGQQFNLISLADARRIQEHGRAKPIQPEDRQFPGYPNHAHRGSPGPGHGRV